jgi:hypothetical protein
MRYGLLIGLGSGLVSALLFFSAARGGPTLGMLLLLLTPLPSLLAGLAWGWLPAAAGAIAGALAMAGLASPMFAVGYFLGLGAPTAMLAYLAYLSRPAPHDDTVREWYPAGRLIAALALYGGALPVLIMPLIGGSYESLRGTAQQFFRRFSTSGAPELGIRPLSEQQVEALADFVIAAMPAAIAIYWLAIMTPNLYLAGRIARASGRLGRDWPDLAALAYPAGLSLVLGLAVLASFVPGVIGVAGTSFSGALLFAYLLAGLALVHFIARHRARWMLWIVYAALLLFVPYGAILVTIAGLLDPIFKLKQRFGAPPPPT